MSTFPRSIFNWDSLVAATLLRVNHGRMDMCSTCLSQTHAHTRQTEQFCRKIHLLLWLKFPRTNELDSSQRLTRHGIGRLPPHHCPHVTLEFLKI